MDALLARTTRTLAIAGLGLLIAAVAPAHAGTRAPEQAPVPAQVAVNLLVDTLDTVNSLVANHVKALEKGVEACNAVRNAPPAAEGYAWPTVNLVAKVLLEDVKASEDNVGAVKRAAVLVIKALQPKAKKSEEARKALLTFASRMDDARADYKDAFASLKKGAQALKRHLCGVAYGKSDWVKRFALKRARKEAGEALAALKEFGLEVESPP